MADIVNIQERLDKARDLKSSLEDKFEKVKGSPREEEFKIQLDKVNDLIGHLEDELDNA